MIKPNVSWRDEPRSTVRVVRDEFRQQMSLQGTQSFDANRANLFCIWEAVEDGVEEDPLWGPRGCYRQTSRSETAQVDAARIEVEVRFAFNAVEDACDHAEVYVWQVYRWELVDGEAICQKDESFGGEYVVESGGLDGSFAIFQPVVAAGVERIRNLQMST